MSVTVKQYHKHWRRLERVQLVGLVILCGRVDLPRIQAEDRSVLMTH